MSTLTRELRIKQDLKKLKDAVILAGTPSGTPGESVPAATFAVWLKMISDCVDRLGKDIAKPRTSNTTKRKTTR